MPFFPTTFDDATNAFIVSIQRRQNDLRGISSYHACVVTQRLARYLVQEQCVAEFREDLETHHAPVEVSLCAKLCFYSCIVMDVSRPRTKLSMFGAVGRTSAVLSKVFGADISQYVMPCSIRISV